MDFGRKKGLQDEREERMSEKIIHTFVRDNITYSVWCTAGLPLFLVIELRAFHRTSIQVPGYQILSW